MRKILTILALIMLFSCKKEELNIPIKRCSTDEPHDWLLNKEIPDRKIHKIDTAEVMNQIVTIPVIFHVVHNVSSGAFTGTNIPDIRIYEQMDILNRDFAGLNSDSVNIPIAFRHLKGATKIQFCLAQRDESNRPTTGIIRKYANVSSWSSNGGVKCPYLGGDTAWNADKYMNVWVCNLTGSLGYANYPGGNPPADGIVIRYSVVGYNNTYWQYNLGKTLVHEVGHFFGVYHTFWGDCSDDLINDTPIQGSPNFNCPVFPKYDVCNTTYPGVMYSNYMDDSYDNCVNIFTIGQCRRMDSVLRDSRRLLCNSRGCRRIL